MLISQDNVHCPRMSPIKHSVYPSPEEPNCLKPYPFHSKSRILLVSSCPFLSLLSPSSPPLSFFFSPKPPDPKRASPLPSNWTPSLLYISHQDSQKRTAPHRLQDYLPGAAFGAWRLTRISEADVEFSVYEVDIADAAIGLRGRLDRGRWLAMALDYKSPQLIPLRP